MRSEFVSFAVFAAYLVTTGLASAAALSRHVRTRAVTRTAHLARDEIGIVTYCSEPDFGGECTDVEPFDACVGLEGDSFDKQIVSFATSEYTNCELFTDYQCTQSTSFLGPGMSVGNGGGGISGVGVFEDQVSSFKCFIRC